MAGVISEQMLADGFAREPADPPHRSRRPYCLPANQGGIEGR
jgi:hypothetical protein